MYFPFTSLLLKSYISFTGSQCELHIFLHEIRHLEFLRAEPHPVGD